MLSLISLLFHHRIRSVTAQSSRSLATLLLATALDSQELLSYPWIVASLEIGPILLRLKAFDPSLQVV